MISIKKYLDAPQTASSACEEPEEAVLTTATLAAYRSALSEMGSCSLNACPALGNGLRQSLGKLEATPIPRGEPRGCRIHGKEGRRAASGLGPADGRPLPEPDLRGQGDAARHDAHGRIGRRAGSAGRRADERSDNPAAEDRHSGGPDADSRLHREERGGVEDLDRQNDGGRKGRD